jgi:hypothetical protein
MGKYQPVHRQEVSPLDILGNMMQENPPSRRHLALVVDRPSEPTPEESVHEGRLRRLGTYIKDELRPSTGDWGGARLALGMLGGVATVYGGCLYLATHTEPGGETYIQQPHYYMHLKATPHDDNLEGLVERYGEKHSRWTERHAEQIADDLVNSYNAMTKSHGAYLHYIQYPAEQLKPGETVQVVRSLLEKPETLGALPHSPSTH